MLDDVTPRAYFTRLNDHQFRATEHVSGAWTTTEQHVSPALGLLAHAIEVHRDARRDDQLPLARLSYDIFGTIPIDVVDIEIEVVRPGSTIELVEARLRYAGRVALVLRAWPMNRYETAAFAAAPLGRIEPPDRMAPWDPSTFWPGGFVGSVEVRRAEQEPGRAVFWLRTSVVLVDGEPVSDLGRADRSELRISPRRRGPRLVSRDSSPERAAIDHAPLDLVFERSHRSDRLNRVGCHRPGLVQRGPERRRRRR